MGSQRVGHDGATSLTQRVHGGACERSHRQTLVRTVNLRAFPKPAHPGNSPSHSLEGPRMPPQLPKSHSEQGSLPRVDCNPLCESCLFYAPILQMRRGRLQDLPEAKQLVNQGAQASSPRLWDARTSVQSGETSIHPRELNTDVHTSAPPGSVQRCTITGGKNGTEACTATDKWMNKMRVPTWWGAA